MAIPTREECITFAQNLLADPLGEVFTTSVLADPFEAAFRMMYAEMDKNQVSMVRKAVYTNLAAYTSQLTPATAGITDFGEIINLEERSVGSTVTISAATNATPIQITTASAHGLSEDAEVTISGVLGNTAANGRWFVSVVSSVQFTLIGSIGNAAYTSGGSVTTSGDRFQIVEQRSELPQRDPANTLNVYAWDSDTFKFIGATTQRQLRIAYMSSGDAPATGSVGVDGSKNYLSYMTAAIAGPTRGRTTISDAFEAKCLGPRRDGTAGYLYELIQPMVRALQRQPVRMKAYRSGFRSSTKPPSGFVYNPVE